jgi:hypothetical protein
LGGNQHRPDLELDNLPPWRDDGFSRFPTKLNLQTAKARFLKSFPKGLDDPDYERRERGYKESAHRRYRQGFEPSVKKWLDDRDAVSIVAGLRAVYGGSTGSSAILNEKLNLLYPKVEEPAYFDALENGGESLFQYVGSFLHFLDSMTEGTFKALVESLLKLPTRPGGATLDHWTTLTWLPFVARPSEHVFLKPTISQTFASILPFDIHYRADLNFRTYYNVIGMSVRLREELQHSELNLSRRPLNMIDVQSFMWVVDRYLEPSLENAAE